MPGPTISIRRYPNRRLYDRTRGRYVTLQDIEQLVRSGHTVEVHDSRTGEELTRQILAQILLERYPDRMDLFPVAMLHSVLQANDLVLEFWRGCLRQSLAALEGWQDLTPGPTTPTSATATTTPPAINPMAWMSALFPFAGLAPGTSFPLNPTPATPGPAPALDADALARRVAELEDRLRHVETRAPKPPRPEHASSATAGARPARRKRQTP